MQVTGDLPDHLTSWDALRAALPVGTVSGAPKVISLYNTKTPPPPPRRTPLSLSVFLSDPYPRKIMHSYFLQIWILEHMLRNNNVY